MILFIGSHRAVEMYCKYKGIPPTERRILARFEDLRGYHPEKLPEVICVGDWYKWEAFSELYKEAQALGFKTRVVM